MSSRPIVSPDEWAARIPWHVKSRALAAIDKALETKRADLARVEETLASAQEVVDVMWSRAAARTHLELRGTDAEGRARLQLLDEEMRAAAAKRPEWATRKPRRELAS